MDGMQAISSGTAYPQYSTETKPSQEAEETRKYENEQIRDKAEISDEARLMADTLKENNVEEKEHFQGFTVEEEKPLQDAEKSE